jgi:glucose-6-phosphate 1-dehydrogenase
MEPPAAERGDATEAASVALLEAVRRLRSDDVVRGQYRGYRAEDASRRTHGLTLFGSETGVEAAWRIVDPILSRGEPPCEYDRGSWGPAEANHIAAGIGGWAECPAPDGGVP